MALKIKQDHARFRDIVRGRIKRNLKKYIQKGELIGKKGKEFITIPVPTIDMPHFRFGERSQGGVGQGEGQPGDPLSQGDPQPGTGQAGQGEGQHVLEVDVSLEELAEILGEELALPRIQPRGKDRIVATKLRYTGISPSGPESLRHFKRN
jgi:uncharacterized protein